MGQNANESVKCIPIYFSRLPSVINEPTRLNLYQAIVQINVILQFSFNNIVMY